MAEEWYYARGGEKAGPVTHAELLELARSSGLDRKDVVWAVGMPKWAEAGSVDGLFPPMSEPPPLTGGDTTSTPTALSPGGLMPALVGMFVVSGLGLLLGLLGVLQADKPVVRVLLALGVAHNAAAVALTFAVTRLRNYRLASAAPWVVMTCWVWHWLSNVTHGMTLLGMALAVSAGVWGFVVIRSRAVRRAFEADPPLPPLFGWHTVASFFDTTDAVRRLNLAGKWEPTQEGEPGLEFTDEGAVIRGDGRAGKYTLGGDRLVIQIEGVPGETLELVKLSGSEMVLGVGGRVRSYRKRQGPSLFGSILGSLSKAGRSAGGEAASPSSEAVSSSDPVVADIMAMMNASRPKGLDEFEKTLGGMGLTPDQLATLHALLRRARGRTGPPMNLYCDCPNCGTPLDISEYVLGNKHTGQDVVCRCRATFSPSTGLNIRNSPEVVERRSKVGRILWGQTRQKSRKEQADHQISQLHWLIREATLQGNYSKAQFHQSQLDTLLQHYEW